MGHVALWGYPRAGSSGAAAPVGPPVTGTVAARVLVLSPDIEPLLARLLGGLLGLPVLDEDPPDGRIPRRWSRLGCVSRNQRDLSQLAENVAPVGTSCPLGRTSDASL